MSAPKKMRGNSVGHPANQITRLKVIWCDGLTEEERRFWRNLFVSNTTQAQIRREIAAKLNVQLNHDARLTEFRQWVEAQESIEEKAARLCMEAATGFPEVQQVFRATFDMLKMAKAAAAKKGGANG